MTAITYDYLNRLEQAGFNHTQADALIVFSTQLMSDMTNKLETSLEKQLSHQIEQSEAMLETQIDKVQLQTNHLDSNIKSLEHKMEQRFDLIDERFKWVDQRFDAIDKRFELVDKRFNEIDKRFELVDKRFNEIDKRFELVDKRFNEMDKRFELVDKRFNEMDKRFELVDKRFDLIDKRFESLTHLIKWSIGIMVALIPTIPAITAAMNHV